MKRARLDERANSAESNRLLAYPARERPRSFAELAFWCKSFQLGLHCWILGRRWTSFETAIGGLSRPSIYSELSVMSVLAVRWLTRRGLVRAYPVLQPAPGGPTAILKLLIMRDPDQTWQHNLAWDGRQHPIAFLGHTAALYVRFASASFLASLASHGFFSARKRHFFSLVHVLWAQTSPCPCNDYSDDCSRAST